MPNDGFSSESRAGAGEFALAAGRLTEEKGFDTAIAAARAAGVPLVIAGAGPDEGRLRGLAAGADVRFTGLLAPDALAELRARAAVVLAPSRWEEPCPYSVLEALAAGVPVLAVRPGRSAGARGRGCDAAGDRSAAWSEALSELWRTRGLRAERGAAGARAGPRAVRRGSLLRAADASCMAAFPPKLAPMMRRLVTSLVIVCALLAARRRSTPRSRAAAPSRRRSPTATTTAQLTSSLLARRRCAAALADMPADVREYTDCYDVIEKQLLAQLGASSGGSSGGGSSSGGSVLPTWLVIVIVVLALAAMTFGALAIRRRGSRRRCRSRRRAVAEPADPAVLSPQRPRTERVRAGGPWSLTAPGSNLLPDRDLLRPAEHRPAAQQRVARRISPGEPDRAAAREGEVDVEVAAGVLDRDGRRSSARAVRAAWNWTARSAPAGVQPWRTPPGARHPRPRPLAALAESTCRQLQRHAIRA